MLENAARERGDGQRERVGAGQQPAAQRSGRTPSDPSAGRGRVGSSRSCTSSRIMRTKRGSTPTVDARSSRIDMSVPAELARYIARKGSVAVDGVSLTVNEVRGNVFGVNLIPHTQQVTTLGALAVDTRVNIEVDQMARYAERLLRAAPDSPA